MATDVWVIWPTVNEEKSKETCQKWRDAGYKVAILMDGPKAKPWEVGADRSWLLPHWQGFPYAVNLMLRDLDADVVVVAGDDVYPSPIPPQELRRRFLERFPDTFGVASPTGDVYGCSEIACIAPWIGRKFIREAYEGNGPYWEEYWHYYSDTELQAYSVMKGAFTKWPDVIQYHDHWQRRGEKRPEYLFNARDRHPSDKALFERRSKAAFPLLPLKSEMESAWKIFYSETTKGMESRSGVGSTLENTKEIREALPLLLKKYNVKEMADIPCGDWNWMRCVDLGTTKYFGYDIVEELLKENRLRYPDITFHKANIFEDILPKFNLVLVRDLFFHLPTDLIIKAIRNLSYSGSNWLLTTSFPKQTINTDLPIQGTSVGFRKINLQLPPFNFPTPFEVIQENDSPSCQGRILGLWPLPLTKRISHA